MLKIIKIWTGQDICTSQGLFCGIPLVPRTKLLKEIDFWNKVSKEINVNVVKVKRKMENFLASYRRERRREGKSVRYVSGTDEIYHSTLFVC